MRFNAFNERQRIVDNDVHGSSPVALIIEWALASIGVFGTHVLDKCLLPIRHIDQKVNVAIAFAQQFIAYTSSYKVNLPVEGRILMDDILDEMEGFFEFIHFGRIGRSNRNSRENSEELERSNRSNSSFFGAKIVFLHEKTKKICTIRPKLLSLYPNY